MEGGTRFEDISRKIVRFFNFERDPSSFVCDRTSRFHFRISVSAVVTVRRHEDDILASRESPVHEFARIVQHMQRE